ncbi:MAG: hypothetical protein L6408_00670 [Nanoarchaeota archaeon]|nr:hypothetical protein [Nanoarchaeota archaeon]
MKKIILPIIILLISMFAVSAADIEVSHELLTEDVYPGERAQVNIMIKNNKATDDYFKIEPNALEMYPLLPFSAFKDVIPPIRSQVDIPSGQKLTFPFDIYIKDGIEPDRRYTLNFNIKSGTDPELKVKYPVSVDVSSPEELIKVTSDMPDEIIPGKEVVFTVTFRNQANMMVDPIELYIDSELFSKQYSEKLYPTPYEITKTLKFTPDPTAKPGTYELGIRAYKGKTLRGKLITTFNVASNPDVLSKVETSAGFLTRTVTVTKSNKGNVAVEEYYAFPLSWLQKMSTSYNYEPQKISSGKVEWYFTLQPDSQYVLRITTDYRILFFSLVVIFIAAIALIYYIRRGVLIKKEIFSLRNEKGVVSEIKILIHIVNRTPRPIRDVKVVDILPNLLKVEKEFGTIKPVKIQKGEKMSRIIWNIDELEPKEERIISYKVKPGIHILGRIVLPAALIRYRTKERKIIDVKSNKVVFFSGSKEKKEE